jgi:predicted dehydrogenase
MNGMIDVGIIGAGPHARSLLDHQAPLGRIRLAGIAASPDGADMASTADLAARAGIAVLDWTALAVAPALRAILVFAPACERVAPVLTALRAGMIVLCPPPIALSTAELAEITAAEASGGGRILCGGEIVHSQAGRRGLAAMRAPEFGPLRSLYLAIRQPRGGPGDVLDALGWEALDFIGAALPAGVSQVRVNGGALFGSVRDTVVLLLRGGDDAVATVELSRCLPPTLPAPGLGEVEIEAFGAHQAVRIEPQASAVRICTDTTLASVPWLDAPVLAMLRAVEHAADHVADREASLPRAAQALATMTAIRAAQDGAGVARLA